MLEFVYQSLPGRVVFAADAFARLPDEIARLGIQRALLLSTPGHRHLAEEAARLLGGLAVGIHDQAVMHVPIETAEAGRAEARRLGADGCIAIGGGSTIGLGKAIVLELDLPLVALPTTYSGSEMTPIQGMTAGGIKRTQRDPKMLPKTVIYDPKLTLSLPASISGPSGMNAVAHCVEALYAQNANPMTSLMAEEGIGALARSLPVVVREPANLAARAEALYGAWLAGAALSTLSMALHHKLCHVLGGSFDLPHAEVHTVILPHAASYNSASAPDAMARIARALGTDAAAPGLFDLAAALGAKMRLADVGMRAEDLDPAADLAMRDVYDNPAPLTQGGIRALLDDAFHGRRPTGE